jgi:mannose-6-phosphate isomerase-like protein (cupin superfamily)
MKRLTVPNALAELSYHDEPFKLLFESGSLQVEIYKPDQVDLQQPHSRGEVYVVASGRGYFVNGGVEQKVQTGEVLFVPAEVEHRFFDFTEDFSTWVFFYGPEGGEARQR